MLYSLCIGPSRSTQEAWEALNQAGSCLGGVATIPSLPDLSCTTSANVQSQARGASFPGKVLWESAPLMYMHGRHTHMHASLQERTCPVQMSSTSLEDLRGIALECRT